MPCDFKIPAGMTKAQRRKGVDAALDRLEKALAAGRVRVRVGREGSVAFDGWDDDDRDGVSDLCAYRQLAARGSSALRMATARGEAMAGRKVDQRAVAAGVHSHDGGKTWGKH